MEICTDSCRATGAGTEICTGTCCVTGAGVEICTGTCHATGAGTEICTGTCCVTGANVEICTDSCRATEAGADFSPPQSSVPTRHQTAHWVAAFRATDGNDSPSTPKHRHASHESHGPPSRITTFRFNFSPNQIVSMLGLTPRIENIVEFFWSFYFPGSNDGRPTRSD